MKRLEKEHIFTPEEKKKVGAIASDLDLLPETVAILYGRGFEDEDAIATFLHPGKERFFSPFLMSGMREASERIALARDRREQVAVYGDYDCDGVCSCAILKRALSAFGIDVQVFVPERRDGYGLKREVLDRVFDACSPTLLISADCGITGAEEVEYIKNRGCDVVVTDHHEIQQSVPDCICVNSKFRDDYPFDSLCGAGTAFKLACALLGERAYEYLDFAAIATIGDSVPLIGENRDIVAEGMKLVNERRHRNYAELMGDGFVTSSDVSFYLAPRLNAAGRMGHAETALRLFCSENESEIEDLSRKILDYNKQRQQICDRISASAKGELLKKGTYDKVIVLSGEGWNTGFVGIAASRIADEYSRPAILLTGDEELHGSARSVGEVNIFEAMRSCSELFTTFGGHAYAAGVGIMRENLPEMERRVNQYLEERYGEEDFSSAIYICDAPEKFSARFVEELKAFEPCGVGNKKPLFAREIEKAALKPAKEGSAHCSFFFDDTDYMFFGGRKFATLLESSCKKRIVFEYDSHTFRGKEYVSGIVRDVCVEGEAEKEERDLAALKVLAAKGKGEPPKKISFSDAQRMLDEAKTLGTVFLASDEETLSRYSFDLECDLFAPADSSLVSRVILCPQSDLDFTDYHSVVFLDDAESCPFSTHGDVYSAALVPAWTNKLQTGRETLLEHFATIKSYENRYVGDDPFSACRAIKELSPLQAAFDLVVFFEMGLVAFSDGKLVVRRGKGSLENSRTYLAVRKYDAS